MRPMIPGLVVLGSLAGCSASPPAVVAPVRAASIETVALSTAAATIPAAAAPSSLLRLEPMEEGGAAAHPQNYVVAKGGVYSPVESETGSGIALNAAFGHYINRAVSVELEAGYLTADPDAPSSDLTALPVMLNGRLNAPIWILEAYVGAGAGAMLWDSDPGSSSSRDGWLWAGSVFLGADATIVEHLTGGLELKYYFTQEIRDTDVSLDGLALMMTLGWRF